MTAEQNELYDSIMDTSTGEPDHPKQMYMQPLSLRKCATGLSSAQSSERPPCLPSPPSLSRSVERKLPMSDAKAAPESGRYYSPTTGALVPGATATDAKREGYYPSITTLKYELAEPWNLKQSRERLIAKAAGNAEVTEYADRVEWQDRIREEAVADWRAAAQRGTAMHALIALYLNDGLPAEMPAELLTVMQSITNIGMSEGVVFCHEYGFAGTSDCFAMYDGQATILDFKTQGIKDDKPNYYAEWRMQLAGYLMGLTEQGYPALVDRCMSVVINTNPLASFWRDTDQPGVFTKIYKPAQIVQAMNKIKLAASMWYVNRGVKEELLPSGVRRMLG